MLQPSASAANDREVRYVRAGHLGALPPATDLPTMWASPIDVNTYGVREGDLLVGEGGDVGRTAFAACLPTECIIQNSVHRLRPRPGNDLRYVRYCLDSIHSGDWLEVLCNRSTFGHLTREKLVNIPIPRLSLPAQRGIADYLDAETARIDTLIAKKRQLLTAYLERAIQQQAELACGRDRPGGERRDSGQIWLGEIPADWRVSRLKHEARLESGHTPSRTRPELWENCTIPWVALNDVGNMASLEFIDQTVNLISEQGIASSSARVLPKGTVILSRDATIGRTAILAVPMATSQHFADWICGENLDSRYLWLLFRTVMKPHLYSLTDGATLRTIGMPDIRELVVPLPVLEQQRRIVTEAAAIRDRAKQFESASLRQIDLLIEHRQGLITAAVTGKIEVPGVAAA